MQEWASSWIRGQIGGDKVRSQDILRYLGLAFFDSSASVWKATQLGVVALGPLMTSQDYRREWKHPRIPRLIKTKENMRGLECLAYVVLRAGQYALSLSRLTRPYESRKRLRKALESLTFADIAALALLSRGIGPWEAYTVSEPLIPQGFVSRKLKLRRYGVWIVRATRSYMKKKGLNPLDYTVKEWQYVWGMPPVILEPESRLSEPKVYRHPKVLKLNVKAH